jgi:DNA-binding response OmpR family regulator
MLAEHNLDVDTSESAEEALGYLSRQKPDMIFLDHTMPGMNGLEVLKVIKDNPDTSAIPVMMYTSQEDSTYMSKARELGAIDVLPKQLKPIELKEALTRLDTEQKVEEVATDAANETIKADKEELQQLVMHAEAALEQETIEQQLRLKIESQREEFEQEISELHQKIDVILPAAENANHKQTFWNNLFWGVIYLVTVAIFSTIYIQQQNKINELISIQNQQSSQFQPPANTENVVSPTLREQENSRPVQNESQPISNNVQDQTPADRTQTNRNREDIASLQQLFNANNQIPYDELLLGDTVQEILNELIPALQSLDFAGRVNLLAHDGRFCVNTGNSGQFELAADDTAVTQCQITEASDRLADIASIDVLQLVTSSNQSADSDFVITMNALSTNQPLENYPVINDSINAGTWNTIALKNRRIDIQIIEGD